MGEMTAVNLMSLMGDNGAQQKQRQKERQQKREERKAQGISEEEIAKLEAEEDAQAEQEALQKSTGNTLQDLEVCKFVTALCHCQIAENAVPGKDFQMSFIDEKIEHRTPSCFPACTKLRSRRITWSNSFKLAQGLFQFKTRNGDYFRKKLV